MIRALDPLFFRARRQPQADSVTVRRSVRENGPSLKEPNRFEASEPQQLWSAPAFWRL